MKISRPYRNKCGHDKIGEGAVFGEWDIFEQHVFQAQLARPPTLNKVHDMLVNRRRPVAALALFRAKVRGDVVTLILDRSHFRISCEKMC